MTKRAQFVLPSGQILEISERKAKRRTAVQKTRTKIQELLRTADETRSTKKMTPEQVRELLRWKKDTQNARNS